MKAAKARWAQGQLEAQANPKARRLHNLPEPRTGTTTRRTRPQRHPPCPPRANGKQPTPPPAPAAIAEARFAKPGEPARGGGRFRGKCETVANTFLLSRRETEILFFLAKGHNAAYIQEKLYISEGTAKTHIRHIYRKCDIHNQQDLMRMVEDAQPTE